MIQLEHLDSQDNAGSAVRKINEMFAAQGDGIEALNTDDSAATVAARVNMSIGTDGNRVEEVDADADESYTSFSGKVNSLMDLIAQEGGDTPTPPGGFSWEGKSYIAFGDSITDPTVNTMDDKYCKMVATKLGMLNSFTNAGVSGSTMVDTDSYNYPVTSDRITATIRSFVHELLPGGDTIADDSIRSQIRGPYSVIDWGQYDLVTIMLGVNDYTYILARTASYGSLSGKEWNRAWTPDGLDLSTFYGAYEASVGTIKKLVKSDCVVVLCSPPEVHYVSGEHLLSKIAEAVERVAAKYGCYFMDFYSQSGINDNLTPQYMYDNIHLNVEGHRVLADLLEAKLNEIAGG